MRKGFVIAAAAMAAVVVLSNVLVQYPVALKLGRLDLADVLTYGAFTYPLAFFVSDLTNRRYGPRVARLVVLVGFAAAIGASIMLSTPRIAAASGAAYLVGQLFDVTLFNRLRRLAWWRAPLAASVAGSLLDTVIFFSLAFAPVFVALGPNDPFAIETAPLFGLLPAEAPRWISWALGDLSVKLAAALILLAPYRLVMGALVPVPGSRPLAA